MRCELAPLRPGAWQLFHDFETLRALAADDGLDEAWAGVLARELNRFCNEHDAAILPRSTNTATPRPRTRSRRSATRTSTRRGSGRSPRPTARRCGRFTTQLRYMDEYPDYRFACSQAQQYAWIKERDPELWRADPRRGRARAVRAGRRHWIEPDCNIPSGESLVRQFLHGQRFFEREFGRRCTEFWNPDVFGYNGQLPQLMREAGITVS